MNRRNLVLSITANVLAESCLGSAFLALPPPSRQMPVTQRVRTTALRFVRHHQHVRFHRSKHTVSHGVNSTLDVRLFEDCWNANSWSVNPSKDARIDTLLQRLCSPAPQALFVLARAICHHKQENNALERTLSQYTYLLKPGFEFQVLQQGDASSTWRIERCSSAPFNDVSDWKSVPPNRGSLNAVELAHMALELCIDAAENSLPINQSALNDLVQRARRRLSLTLGTDIRGRASADAAFAWSIAGVTDKQLYEYLTLVAKLELERTGRRPSFCSKYVLHVVEKLAAAGIQDTTVNRVAADCLASKGNDHLDVVDALLRPEGFDLFSTRPLLWLWRFSARQRKVASSQLSMVREVLVTTSAKDEKGTSLSDWVNDFDDPFKPLVVDLGCGLGISLLGLATVDEASQEMFNSSSSGKLLDGIDWPQCNFVGGDISQLSLGYGRGIAKRWGLNGRLQFVNKSALDLIQVIFSHYPGPVTLVMIQFPTPFQLCDTGGNSQLPSNYKSGFMVSEELLQACRRVLVRFPHDCGSLLLQSNCEDVAVLMREMAENAVGFDCLDLSYCVSMVPESESNRSLRVPQRTLDWLQLGGKRAVGRGWSPTSLLPCRGATETEVSCQLNKTPVHRCLLQPRPSS